MSKKLLYLLTIGCLLLAACAPAAATERPADTNPTTVSGDEGDEPADSGRCGDRSQLASEIQLYTWVEYMDPAIKDQFEAECGVKVTETNYDSNETLLATLQAGSTGYDIIIPSDYMAQLMVELGMLEKLDFNNIPNIANMGSFHLNQYFDPTQEYTVPYFWGTSGFAVDTNVIPDPVASWDMVFKPTDETCGKISLLDDQRETIGAALMYLGYSINDTDPAHLEEAKNLLIEHAPCVKAYDSMSHDDLIVQGETVIAHIWTGDAILAGDPATGGREGIVYLIPTEGCTIWQDNMAIPVGAPNKYTAEIFMNYIADPEIGAQNAEFVGYATPNEEAKAHMDPEVLANPGVYPDEATMANLQWIEDVGEALTLYDRTWTEFKAAAGG